MATRSITTVRSQWVEDGAVPTDKWEMCVTIYVHSNGFLEGVGQWLYQFLNGMVVVNGIGNDMPARYANGPGRMAAQIIVAMHSYGMGPSCIPHGSVVGQEYHYQIDVLYGPKGGSTALTVFAGPMTAFGYGGEHCTHRIFQGSVEAFGNFLEDSLS